MQHFLWLLLFALPVWATDQSVCYGTPSKGRLEAGVQITKSGPNFEPYSSLGVSLGRTYVHAQVGLVIDEAYKALAQSMPATTFMYGESGWAAGGRIRPH